MTKSFSLFFPIAGMLYGTFGIIYILSKVRLAFKYGGTHVGHDVILIVYLVSAIAAFGAFIGVRLNNESKKLKPIAWIAALLTIAVLITWSGLNLGGYIIPHGAMIKG